jgi:uncharacterized protein (TIRG00374 family)
MEPEAAALTSPDTTHASARPRLEPRAVVRRAIVLIAVLVFVFGILLPRLVDLDAVRATLAGLAPRQLLLLGATTVVAYVASAAPYRVLVPGLSWPRAVGSDLAARAVASTVPGPSDVATRYVLYRQWSVPADAATSGTVLSSLLESLSYLALPAIAVAGMLIVDHRVTSETLYLAVLSLIALAAGALVLGSIVRSESLARKLGSWLDRTAKRISGLLHRTPPADVAPAVLAMRERSKVLLTRGGQLGFAAAVLGKLAWFVVLETALWCVGVGPDVLPPSAVLSSMALVGLLSLVPITPGGVGTSEVAYIAILSSVTGANMAQELTAAVSLFRIAQWFAPIPIGWLLLALMRRGHWQDLLGDREMLTAPTTS